MIRIEHAYCVQLNRLVTIDEARRAFGAQRDFERFDFYCAEAACATHRVRIAGVNYRIDAATGRKFVENHFRRWDEHRSECPYAEGDVRDGAAADAKGGAHLTHALSSDAVTIFDPPLDEVSGRDPPTPSATNNVQLQERRDRPWHPREMPASLSRSNRTSSLARLVDTYRHARAQLTPQELAAYRITVSGEGHVPLVRYVLPVTAAREGPPCRVYYGGARLIRYYGRGFKLRFFDRLRHKPVFLYVSSAAFETAVQSAALRETLHELERGEYATVYVLGRLDESLSQRAFSIAVTDARRVVLQAQQFLRIGS